MNKIIVWFEENSEGMSILWLIPGKYTLPEGEISIKCKVGFCSLWLHVLLSDNYRRLANTDLLPCYDLLIRGRERKHDAKK